MLKGFKKMSRQNQAFAVFIILGLVVLLVIFAYQFFRPAPKPEYQVVTARRGDIQSTFDTQGTVESLSAESFEAASGVRVLEVNVAVGDRVRAGDKLASFDVTALKSRLGEYKAAYEKAKASYETARRNAAEGQAGAKAAAAEIARLQKEIPQLQKAVEAAKKEEAAAPDRKERLSAYIEKLRQSGMSDEEILAAVQEEIKKADISAEVRAAVGNSSLLKELQLVQKQARLSVLQGQLSANELQSDETLMTLYKSLMEKKRSEYERYRAACESMGRGWISSSDGVVTVVNIRAGEVFVPPEKTEKADLSALLGLMQGNADIAELLAEFADSAASSPSDIGEGLVVESTDDFIVSFTVGKYDLLDLKVGQKATVRSLGSAYDAEVSYVSATASVSASLDISSLASSLTGAASNTASAPVKVKIHDPDEKIIIGFDVDVMIDTETISGVLTIPVDCVMTDENRTYAFVYDPDRKTVEEREVRLGMFSSDEYEVLDGVSEGEKLVMNPKSALTDGMKIAAKEVSFY